MLLVVRAALLRGRGVALYQGFEYVTGKRVAVLLFHDSSNAAYAVGCQFV